MHETIIENPTWEQIEIAIHALNNQNRNDLYLNTNNDYWLGIGGGAGQYLLTGGRGDDWFTTLVDPDNTFERKVLLNVGGQSEEYPANRVQGITQTLWAVRDFYDTSRFNKNANWITEEET